MATKTENRRIYIYINGKMVQNNMRDIRKAYYKTRAELEKMDRSAKEYNSKAKDLRKLSKVMDDHRNKVRGVSRAYNRMKELAFAVLGGNLLTAAVMKIQQGFQALIDGAYDLADAEANVRKTTQLTAQEFDDLSKRLRKIDTRTGRKELLALAEEAGRLGHKSVDDVEQFVKAADQLSVALGDDLGSDKAIRSVGKLTQTFMVAEKNGYNMEESMLAVGSAINELSASGTVQANYLVDFTSRLSGAAVQANIAETEIMGFAATLDEAGQKVEMSGTALTQVILDMYTNTAAYADIAGMSVEKYTQLLNRDANEALLVFLEGLNGNNAGLKEMSSRLDTLGVDGVRATSVLATLAQQTDKVREKQTLANDAFREGTSLTQEFNLRNNNMAGVLDKIKKRLMAAFMNSSILSGMETMVMWLGKITGAVKTNVEMLEEEQKQLFFTYLKITDTNTAQEDRLKLINKLKKEYPKLLGNLDAEKVSNEELADSMQLVNEKIMDKLILAKKDSEIAELAADMNENQEKRADAQVNIGKQLYDLSKRANIELLKEGTVKEKAIDLAEKLKTATNEQGQGFKQASKALQIHIEHLNQLEKQYSSLEYQKGRMQTEKDFMKEMLGAKEEERQAKANGNTLPTFTITADKPTPTQTETIKTAVKKQMEVFSETLDEESKKKIPEMEKTWVDFFTETLDSDGVTDNLQEKLDKQFEQFIKAHNEIDLALQSPTEQWLADMKSYYDQLLSMAIEHGYKVEAIEEERKRRIQQGHFIKLNEQLNEDMAYAQAAIDLGNSISNAFTQRDQQDVERIRQNNEHRHKVLEDRLNADLITERQYNHEKEMLDNELKERERKMQMDAFKREKAAKVAQATINAALATTQALASMPPPGSFVMASLVGAAAAVQVATIAAQEAPKFAKGGILDGPSHRDGGLPIFNPKTGKVIGEMEGGEPILSREFAQRNPEWTAAALNASKTGARLNIPYLGAQPQPKFASGGYAPARSGGASSPVSVNASVDNSGIERQLIALRKDMKQLRVQANISLNQLHEAEDDYDQIQKLGDMS